MTKRYYALIISGIGALAIVANTAAGSPIIKRTSAPASTSSDSVRTASPSPLLRVIQGAGAAGNLKPGVRRYAPGTRVQFSFVPKPGHSEAKVVLDGKLVRPKGTVTMNGDHCLWAFGNPKTGTPFKDFMTVPSDVTKIPYPAFYQNRPSFGFKVADPYCALSQDVVAYPSSYLGDFPLPPVVGAPLPSSVKFGVALHDVWDPNSASYNSNSGCREKARDAFLITLQRMKRLNARRLTIVQWTYVMDWTADPLVFHKGEWMGFPEAEMPWIVKQAKTEGFDVYELMDINDNDFEHKPMTDYLSYNFVSRFLDGLTKFMVNRAVQAEQLGIDALRLDATFPCECDRPPYRELYLEKLTRAAKLVRQAYRGKLLCGHKNPWFAVKNKNLMDQIDMLEFWLPIGGLTEAENADITVTMLKEKCLYYLNELANVMSSFSTQKPVYLWLYIQSHRDYLVRGWVEDTFDSGRQKGLKIDFSVQALTFEAALEAIAEQTRLTIPDVDTMAYWFTDCILPRDSYPNLGGSVRNKPAESILYQWFKRE